MNAFNVATTNAYMGIAYSTIDSSVNPNAVWNITNVDTNNQSAMAATFILSS